jgi:hypothetical protein
MKKQTIFLLLAVFVFLLACQSLSPVPARNGTVVSGCGDIVTAVEDVWPDEFPDYLAKTGKKQGGEFDVNEYFDVLTHISMREGYVLDYVYRTDELGGLPVLYARPVDQTPYILMEDVPSDTKFPDFRKYLEIEDVEQGYFEYVVMNIMGGQFYLSWHANYNDRQIVCNRQDVNDIISKVNESDFGSRLNFSQQTKARAIKNIEPAVNLTEGVATVEIVTFTKWGGFYRLTYTISREFPHTIIDVKEEELVPYDCGVMF